MKILIINNSLEIGGIETFFLRLSNELVKNNIEIYFLLQKNKFDNELYSKLKLNSKIFFWDDFSSISNTFLNKLPPVVRLLFPINKKKFFNDVLKNIEHIHVTDINSILFSLRILNFKKTFKIKYSLGVYHINEYNLSKFENVYFLKKLIFFLKNLEANNFLFFNEISRETYSNIYKNVSNECLLAPIGINAKESVIKKREINKNKIVSIGRLSGWKTYNYHMIDVINELKNKKFFFNYDCYGNGEERLALEEKVKFLNLEKEINFYPEISYSKFGEVISDCLMFIGAGTALIESSSEGVPSLIGIENLNKDEPFTYGFLHDLKTLSYQEKELNFKKYKIIDYILKLHNMNEIQYLEQCSLAVERSRDFDITKTASVFIKLIKTSKPIKININYFELFLIVISMGFYKIKNKNKNKNFFKRL